MAKYTSGRQKNLKVGIVSYSENLTSLDVIGGAVFSGESSTEIVRITQTGSGPALLVEDSANPDVTPFVVTADGRIGIGIEQPGIGSYALEVNGGDVRFVTGGEGDLGIYHQDLVSNIQAAGNIQLGLGANSGEAIRINLNNNVGIGTTIASSKLYVVGDGYFTGILTANRIFSSIYGEFTGSSVSAETIVGTSLSISGISTLGTVQISSGIVTATSGVVTYYGDGSQLTNVTNASVATYANNAGIATYATSAGIATYAPTAGIATYAVTAGIATYANNAGIATYAISAGIATYAPTAGIATYAISAGIATYAPTAGIATYAPTAGIATYAISAGIATYASTAGLSTYAVTAGIATYALTAGIATYTPTAGLSTYAVTSGIATYATLSGIATYAPTAGIATNLKGGSGGTLVYQSAIDTTAFLANGSSGQILQSNGGTSAPSWVNVSAAGAITGLTIRDEGTIVGTANSVSALNFVGNIVSVASTAGIATITFLDYVANAGIATYAPTAGISTYAVTAGIATYAPTAGLSTYAVTSGIATYAPTAGLSTYAVTAGIATYTPTSGIASALTSTASVNTIGIITAAQFSTGSGTLGFSTNTISGPSEIVIDPSPVGVGTTSGVVRIRGDLYVDGTQFVVNSSTIELADLNVGIATTVGTNALLDGGGIGIGSANIRKSITWNNTAGALTSSEDWNIASGKIYEIGGTSVLSSTTLGSGVVNSSLTSVGTLGQLNVSGVSTFSGITTHTAALFGTTASFSGVVTASSFNGNASSATYSPTAGLSTYAITAGIATYAVTAGIATYATLSGIATYSTSAGLSTYAVVAGIATLAGNAGFSTVAGIATYATTAGIATYSSSAGIATYAVTAGIATYATNAGVSTSVIGGIVSVTQLSVIGITTLGVTSTTTLTAQQLNVSGVSTFAGITTHTSAIFGTTASFTGVVTASSFSGNASSATFATSSGIATFATSAGISTNLKGGSGGTLVYQSAIDTTAFLANGSSGQILQSNGGTSAPSWVNAAPSNAITGLTVRDEGTIIGAANSISQLNFVGSNVIATATAATGIATITISDNIVGTGLSISGISTIGNFRITPVGTGATVGGIGVTYFGDGSSLTGISAGLTVTDDTSTNATRYVLFDDATSGTVTSINVSTTKLTFNPSTGNLVAGGTVTANSDKKLKTDVQTIENALEKVLSLRGVEFTRIDNGDKQIGVIAQEVEEIIPEVVYPKQPAPNNETKSVAYGNIVGLLIEAIKEQNKEIQELKRRLEEG